MRSQVIKAVNGFKVNELDGGIHVAYGNGLVRHVNTPATPEH